MLSDRYPTCQSQHEEVRMRPFLTLSAALVLVGFASADEEKIDLDKLPKAVVDAVKAKFPQARLLSAEKEKEDGQTTYEVAVKQGEQNLTAIVTPEGKI